MARGPETQTHIYILEVTPLPHGTRRQRSLDGDFVLAHGCADFTSGAHDSVQCDSKKRVSLHILKDPVGWNRQRHRELPMAVAGISQGDEIRAVDQFAK